MLPLLLACLWVFLPLQALGHNFVIPTEPARIDIQNVKFYRISYGFQEDEDEPGHFRLQVNLRYRPWTSRIERVKHLTFRLQSGIIVQRDDRTLVLHLDNREVIVGRHRWWYAPAWQTAGDVRITCGRSRKFRRLVLENCHLIAEKAALNETKGLEYPFIKGTSISREVNASPPQGGGLHVTTEVDLAAQSVSDFPQHLVDRAALPETCQGKPGQHMVAISSELNAPDILALS